MNNVVQKTFKFDLIAQVHSFDGDFPQFTIREATSDDIKESGEKLRAGTTYDILQLLTDCNLILRKTGKRILQFENGRPSRGLLSLSAQEKEQICRKIIEINPVLQKTVEKTAAFPPRGTSQSSEIKKANFEDSSKKSHNGNSSMHQDQQTAIGSDKKDFRLGTNDSDPILVTIREATAEENASREAYFLGLSKQTKDASRFIKDGYRNTPYAFTYELRVQNEEYIDDAYSRFSWIKEGIKSGIVSFENTLTLAACNIQQPWNRGPAFEFTDGHIVGSLSGLSDELMEEIHQKVLEMNPAWDGGFEALLKPLMEIPQLRQSRGNFKELTLTSIFSKSKTYLNSLMQEINTDVFNNMGSIKVNVSSEDLGGNKRALLWALKNVSPPIENIILYYSAIPTKIKSSYIGILEHGSFEIRVVARRDKFNYWDTDIDGVINTLRTAIQWWKTSAVYNAYETETMNEAANDEWVRAEGEAFLSEMEDYGYGDDD